MNNKELEERLKKIKTEDYIWLVYFVLVGMSLYSNVFERRYLKFKDEYSRKKYKELTITVFIVLLIIYFYFYKDALDDLKSLNNDSSSRKKFLTMLSFVATLLVVVSGIIFLYVAIVDKDIEVEVAFN